VGSLLKPPLNPPMKPLLKRVICIVDSQECHRREEAKAVKQRW
jgi:hypothetical protein